MQTSEKRLPSCKVSDELRVAGASLWSPDV